MNETMTLGPWSKHARPPTEPTSNRHAVTEKTKPARKPPLPAPGVTEGYWQEWTPADPQPNMGYDAELHLPPGTYIVNASASVRLEKSASAASDIECSLFVGQQNVSLNQFTLAPGAGESIAATAHVDIVELTPVQWVCGSTTAPFRLSLAITAVKVEKLHHVGPPWP